MKDNEKRPTPELSTKLINKVEEVVEKIEDPYSLAVALAEMAAETGVQDLLGRPITSLEGSIGEHGSSWSSLRGLEG